MRTIIETPEYKDFLLLETKDSKGVQLWAEDRFFPGTIVITNSSQEILFVLQEETGGYMSVVSGG